MTAAILLPALGAGGAAVWTAVEAQREAFKESLRDTVRALTLAVDSEIDTFRSGLATLAGSATLDGPDPDLATFEREARRAAAALDTPAVLLLDPASLRQVINTSLPLGETLNSTSAEVFGRVAETGRFLVTDLSIGGASRRRVVGVAVPVERDGGVRYVLAARMEPARLVALLAAQANDGSFAAVIDGNNVVVARSSNHERFVGQRLLPWVVEGTAGRGAGLLRGENRLGEESLSAFQRLSSAPGWMVVLGEPIEAYNEAAWRPVKALAYGGILALALALVLACWISRRILAPMASLTRRASAVVASGGREAVGQNRPSGVVEFEHLSEAVHQADATLRAERDQTRLYFHVAGTMLVVLGPDGAVRKINRCGLDMLGLDHADQALGRDWIESFIPERLRPAVRETFDAVVTGRIETSELHENPVLRADGTERLVAWRDSRLLDLSGNFVALVSSGEDITKARAAEEHERLLVLEVDHRAKNVLAVVQSVVRLSQAQDIQAFRKVVEGRIASLARSHAVLAGRGWRPADLRALLEAELSFHGAPNAVRLDGPRVAIAPRAAQPMAMVMHELATNAAKHGALSVPAGRVEVRWRLDRAGAGSGGGTLSLRWAEVGGAPVTRVPERLGFGSRLIESTMRGQLGGTIARHWEPGGLIVEVVLPLARVQTISDAELSPRAVVEEIASAAQ
ncbi:MAG: HWE histidine kinase domain-containing protein [Pseudomonadota bacterium]